jgi:DNA gyrase subunit A
VDGHGNFGSMGGDDSPAAMRYTEARLTAAAMEMVASIDEDTVDFIPNYDGSETQPDVLPAGLPNLLVNGASGIAVGMATNMAPHNLGEVIAAARYLLRNPAASLDALMRYVPGPDLPTGGRIVGLEGVREAYETGRGIFRSRATAVVEQLTPRRTGIVVTELPYTIGPEKVMARIKDLVQAKKLNGIADLKDLTDRKRGLHLVIEVRSGFNPDAVLAELYRLTPMEETFGINNVALVDGQPRVLGLKELLEIYVAHRLEVVRRRTEYRRRKRSERLHLVDGLLVALLNIDEVIAVIRSSDDTAAARERLMAVFDLSEIQAQYILDTPLRRLTRYDRLELEREQDTLRSEIASLTAILESDSLLRDVVSDELAEVAKKFSTPRRTVLLEGSAESAAAAVPLEVTDDPCVVLMSATGRVARVAVSDSEIYAERTLVPPSGDLSRAPHDVLAAAVRTTVRGTIGVVTSAGRLVKVNVLELPALVLGGSGAVSLAGGTAVGEFAALEPGETVAGLCSVNGAGIAIGTAEGVVKRVLPEYPQNRDDFEVISLRPGDRVVGAVQLSEESAELVFITSDAQLLRFPASTVRPQGRAAGGMAGVRLSAGASVVWFGVVSADAASGVPVGAPGTYSPAVVVTVAGSTGALPGAAGLSVKVTPLHEYPGKGRATGGVRCQRFLRGEDALVMAWAGAGPALGATEEGSPVILPDPVGRRDGSGIALRRQLAVIGGSGRVP